MKQTNKHMRRGIGRLPLCWLILLCIGGTTLSQDSAVSVPWHEQSAALRFRIEKDDAHSLVPNVSVFDLEPDKKSADVKKWAEKNRWSDKRRIHGQLCQDFLPTFGTRAIIYNLRRDFTHFVGRAAIVDGGDPNASVDFSVYADKRLIFRSGPLTRENPVAEIHAGIPGRSKQLKLIVEAPNKNYLRWAKWVDPGFLLRGAYPKVSFVRLYAPGHNLHDFVPQVYAPSTGEKVNSWILSAGRGEPMDILFETTEGHPSYLVYLTPKSEREASSAAWQGRAGLMLETKWITRIPPSSRKLADLMNLFDSSSAEPVGRSLVENIHHAFAIHRIPEYDPRASLTKRGVGLYYYKGFFPVSKKGNYTFATISRDDSYLSVDDKLVASWPGKHNIYGGIRGQKKGTTSLEPGVHKLEYFHFSSWPNMFAAAAWKKPGEELRIMTRNDFVSVGRYKVTSAGFKDPDKAYAAFEWSVVDDFRLEQAGRSFVTMRFEPIRPNPLVRYSYRWVFDDGTIATDEKVDHVFLRPALRTVHLELGLDDKLLAQATQEVHVHPAWDRSLTSASSTEPFDPALRQRDLNKAPAEDLVNLYILAEQAERPDWKALATTALAANPGRLVEQSADTDFLFEFGRHLQSPDLKKYDEALELFTRLTTNPGVSEPIRQRAAVGWAQVLLKCFGRYDEALKILDGLPTATPDAIMAKAEALAGLGRAKQAIDLLSPLTMTTNPSEQARQQIKHAGLIRHARVLAQSKNDPNQLDQAMANLETVVAEDPAKVLSPDLNLIKLDIHLARGELRAALHLAERLRNLQMNDYDIAEVLARQVVALCGVKDVEKARTVYARLSRDYSHSPALARAKEAMLQALARP